jgi:hypothetical protein
VRADVERDEPGKDHEGGQGKGDVEEVVCDHGVHLIEQQVAGFAKHGTRYQHGRQAKGAAVCGL